MQNVGNPYHIPMKDKWEFDSEVMAIFENMLKRSIPCYETMREAVNGLCGELTEPGDLIIDLGCSNGLCVAQLNNCFPDRTYLGVDCSGPMLTGFRETFEGVPNVRAIECDLRRDFPSDRPKLYLLVLTMQFIPIEYRESLIRRIYESLQPKGAVIVVEKILSGDLFTKLYYKFKESNGYSTEEIERKRLSLEGVLVPLSFDWNEELLRRQGFAVDCFWRWMNFAGWVGIKP